MKYWNDKTRALLLVLLPLLIYGFGIGRGFDFDDVDYISANPLLRRSDAFHVFWFTSEAFNYYPLFWSLLRVQWMLWGGHAAGYHLVNLLMHCVNALLVWRIARQWRLPGAWWAAALFAVHPVNVQTLAWAAEQKNTWSFFFMALALLAFLRHAEERRWLSYALSLLWYFAALGCKTSAICLPAFLVVYYAFSQGRRAWPLLIRLVPFIALGLAAGVTTMWFEQHRVAAKSLLSTMSLWQRMEISGATFWFYLGKALLPIGLTPMYRGWVDSTAATHSFVPGLLLLALLAACAFFWRRIGAPVALGIAYYALMLLPLLGILDTNYFAFSLIADHWQYHALPGLMVAVVFAAQALVRRLPARFILTPARQALIGGSAVAGCAVLASMHFANFEDSRTFWSYVVEQNPDAWMGWYNLGNYLSDDRKYPEAIAAFRQCLRIKPDYARCLFNLGNAYYSAGQLEDADRQYLATEKVSDADPQLHNNRAATLMRLGREEGAIEEFNRALAIDPHETLAHVNLAVILLKLGRIPEAGMHLENAGLLSLPNSQRIADAIGAATNNPAVPRPALLQFARRACEITGNAASLRATLPALDATTPPKEPATSPSN